jgi:hypothetical protein
VSFYNLIIKKYNTRSQEEFTHAENIVEKEQR